MSHQTDRSDDTISTSLTTRRGQMNPNNTDVVRSIQEVISFVEKYGKVQFVVTTPGLAERFDAAAAIAFGQTLIKVMTEAEMDEVAQDQFLNHQTTVLQQLGQIEGQNTPQIESTVEFLCHVHGQLASERWEDHLESLIPE